jgi:hypothetical protein
MPPFEIRHQSDRTAAAFFGKPGSGATSVAFLLVRIVLEM